MKVRYGGPMALQELYQALFQDHSRFAADGITHVRSAGLYFTPCTEDGDNVSVIDGLGNEIIEYVSAGAYKSAADAYDKAAANKPQTVETRAVTRRASLENAPFSPF